MRIYTEHSPDRICARYKGRIDDYTLAEKREHLLALSELCGDFKSWDYGVLKSSLGYTLRRMTDVNARVQYEELGQGVIGYGSVFDHVYMFKNKKDVLFLTAFPYSDPSTVLSVVSKACRDFRVDDFCYMPLSDEYNFISKYNEGFLLWHEDSSLKKLPIAEMGVSLR